MFVYVQSKGKFYDRVDWLNWLNDSLNSKESSVISLWGVPGVGKQNLLKHFLLQADLKKRNILSLNAFLNESYNYINTLYQIRRQISFQCVRFDYAFILYWEKAEMGPIPSFYRVLSSSLMNAISIISPKLALLLNIPQQTLLRIQMSGLSPEEQMKLSTLESLQPDEILNILPCLLANDINSKRKAAQQVVLCLDSINTTLFDPIIIINALKTISNSLIIVSSREEIPEIVNRKKLEGLPQEIAREWLTQENFSIDDCAKIIKLTCCVPKFIRLAITNKLQDKMLFNITNSAEYLQFIVNHYSDFQISLSKLLCIFNVFDKSCIQTCARMLCIGPQYFVNYLKLSIIDKLSTENDKTYYTINTVFSDNFINSIKTDDELLTYLEAAIGYLYNHLHHMPYIVKQIIVSNIIKFICIKQSLVVQNQIICEHIIDLLLFLAEEGLYSEIIMNLNDWDMKEVHAIVQLIKGFCYSKIKSSSSAMECYNDITLLEKENVLGFHSNTLALLKSYSNSLCGNYAEEYKNIFYIYNTVKDNKDLHYHHWYFGKAFLYYADALFLNGKFLDAIIVFEDLKRIIQNDPAKIYDYYEAEKQIGHCFRFNYLMIDAYEKYNICYENQLGIPSLNNYFLTCITETVCYDINANFDKYAAEALKRNQITNHKNNLAKIHCSIALNKALFREYEVAYDELHLAESIYRETNYQSGLLFVYLTRCFVDYFKFKKVNDDILQEFLRIQKKVGIYKYLLLPIYMMKKESDLIDELQENIQWIDIDKTKSILSEFIHQFE